MSTETAPQSLHIHNLFFSNSSGEGQLNFPGGVRFKGQFVGRIDVPAVDGEDPGITQIEEGAKVTGLVVGFDVFVDGHVEGIVVAKGKLTVGPKGVITQGAIYKQLACTDGEIGGRAKKIQPDTDIEQVIEQIRAENR